MSGTSKLISFMAAAACTAMLAGCTTSGPAAAPDKPFAAAAKRFDGEWASADGVASSRFNSGVFTTSDASSGEKVADGSYVLSDERTAQITVKSLVRGTTSNVTCLLATENQLNCTSSTGQTFILNRKVAAAA